MNNKIDYVVKANALINKSRFSLSLQQQKIILYIISKIKRFETEFSLCEFNIRDFCQVCGIDKESGKNYELLKEQIKAIADKSIWIKLENGKETLLRWIEKPYIDENSGKIQIKLDNDMKPYLLQLQKNFTMYEVIYTLHFKSKYTIRLYELLKSKQIHDVHNEIIFSVEELKERLDATIYKEFKAFNTRVIKTASSEINQFSDLNIKCEYIKKSRKTEKIKFIVETKDKFEKLMQLKDYIKGEK